MKPNWQTILTAAIVAAAIAVPVAFTLRTSTISVAPVSVESSTDVTDDPNLKRVSVGELVRLESDGEHVAWTTEPEVSDLVSFGSHNEFCVVSFRTAGRYVAIAAQTKANKVEISRVEIIVGNHKPGKPNGPTPVSNDWSNLVAVWLADVPAEQQKAGAALLAESYRNVAASVQRDIDAGKLVTPQDIIDQTKQSNNAALGGAVLNWRPFFVSLAAEVSKRKLTSMAEHVREWKNLADALEANAQ